MGLTNSKIPLKGLNILITGCDTGFGYESALLAAAQGAIVYAACLTDAGVKNFERLRQEQPHNYASLRSVQLDVTKRDDVQRVAAQIQVECPDGLFCLVNNAGINAGSYPSWTSIEEYRQVMEVNYFGAVQMTTSLLPSLRRYVTLNPTGHAPRIVNIASVAGRTVAPIIAAYCASKHALEAFSDAIRIELRPFGIRVAVIEPWFAATPLVVGNVDKRIEQIRARYENLPHKEDYGNAFLDHHIGKASQPPGFTMQPIQVVRAILDAAQRQEPSIRRIVGGMGKISVFLYEHLPTWIVDMLLISALTKAKPAGVVRNGKTGILSWL